MEWIVSSSIGLLMACGVYLVLQARTFSVVLGLSLMTYAVNIFLFATGRLAMNQAPIIQDGVSQYTDPLPQALVLTAIVISFGMTAVIVVMSLRAYLESGTDRIGREQQSDELDGSSATEPAAVGEAP